MSIHSLSYPVIVQSSTPTSKDDDILRFDVYFEHKTHVPVAVCRQEAENRISFRATDTDYFDSSASVCLHRKTKALARSVATAIAPFLERVPEPWRAKMKEQLVRTVQDLDRQPNEERATVVKFHMKVVTLARPGEEGGDGRDLDSLFEFLTADAMKNPSWTVFEPATLSSVQGLGTVPTDRLESIEDRCSICTEEFGISPSEEEEVVVLVMPCSHKFHRECIIKWLSKNHVCPLCRFRLPHDVMVRFRQRHYASS